MQQEGESTRRVKIPIDGFYLCYVYVHGQWWWITGIDQLTQEYILRPVTHDEMSKILHHPGMAILFDIDHEKAKRRNDT